MKLFSHPRLALWLLFGMTSHASALAPMVLTHPESQMIQTGGSATLSVVVDVSGPLTYQWKKDGVDIPSSNSPNYVLSSVQGTNAGSYTVVVSNADGSCEAGPAAVFVGTRRTVFVSSSAAGSNNGTSWTNAYTSLTTALSNALDGDDIWVAAGTYKPSTTSNRDATFTVAKFVRLFGGFNGTETALQQRNWNANVTTLSGDLSGNDTGLGGNQGDNSKRVVTVSSSSGAVIDGFRVSGGSNTIPAQQPDFGAGIGFLSGGYGSMASAAVVRNCVFRWNSAVSYGGAVGLWGTSSTPLTIQSCVFIQNSAPSNGGGAIQIDNCPLIVRDSLFDGNSTGGSGGGSITANNTRDIVVFNSAFRNNAASSGTGAGGIRAWTSNAAKYRIIQSTFYSNSGPQGAVYFEGTPQNSNCLFANSIIVGSGAPTVTFPVTTYLLSDQAISGSGNTVGTPLFVNAAVPLGADGIFGTVDDGLALQPGSLGINMGSDGLVPSTVILDAAGQPRLLQQVDVGAYEHPQLVNGDFELPALSVPDNLDVNGNEIMGWSKSGPGRLVLLRNVAVNLVPPKLGSQQLLFNSGNAAVGAILVTTIPTEIGRQYRVQFYVGRAGAFPGDMGITARIRDSSANEIFNSRFQAPSTQTYASASQFDFTATTSFSGLLFEDTSLTTNGVDLLLDAVAVTPLVFIVNQPQSITAAQNAPVTFSLTAAGSGALTYQWQKDGVDIPGATSSTFSLASAKPWHIGDYTVKVTDANGTITSNAATLSLTGINGGIWSGIVNYWPFSSSTNDLGFTANHFASTNAVTSPNRFNKAAESYYFDGSAWMVSAANSTITGSAARTVSFWMKHEDMSWYLGYPNLVAWGDVSNTGAAFAVRTYPNKRLLFVHGNAPNKTFGPDNWMDSGKWYHVAITVGAPAAESNTKAYVDGLELGVNAYDVLPGIFSTALTKFRIGTEEDTGGVYNDTVQWRGQALLGWMDDIRVYNRALTASEVAALYAAENAPNNWRQTHFGSTSNAGDAADDADPDRDGLKNLLEYALNLPPNAASRVPASVQATGGNLEYTYTRGTAAFNGGTAYQVEWSDDLTTWSSAGVVETLVGDDGTLQQVKATLPAGSGGRRFVRLRVQ